MDSKAQSRTKNEEDTKKMKTKAVSGKRIMLSIALLIIATYLLPLLANAQPSGVEITYNATETAVQAPASSLTTAGGTFTTLILNGTYKNPR